MAISWTQTSEGIETATASTASEFIETLRPSHPHWWEDEACPWVFRGHAKEDWKLLPSAWRPGNTIVESSAIEAERRFDAVKPAQKLNWFWHPNFWSAEAQFGSDDAALARRLTISTTAEYLPLWDFATRCDELGMPVPLAGLPPDPTQHPDWIADATNPLHGDELLRFSDLPSALALAQHHGIPTRLLDWTRDPMAAAFFAIEPLSEPVDNTNLVVWALHKGNAQSVTTEGVSFPRAPSGAPRFDPSILIARPSTRDNPFLAAQAGLFTSIGRSGIYFMKSAGQRPDIERFILEAKPAKLVLRKLVLSHKHLGDLVEILRRENVSRSSLMPTIDNVANDVLRKWSQQSLVP